MDGLTYFESVGPEDARDDESNPFDQDALHVIVSKPVNDAQLKVEIDQALGANVRISMKDTSVEGHKRLWITPVSDENEILRLVDAHVQDPLWGRMPGIEGLEAALAKLRSGATLTTKEISLVLRGML